MSLLVCPVCRAPLTREETRYVCPGGHCYDIAADGYTHLLPANRKHSAAPGDDKAMARARREFLDRGYYAPLRAALAELALRYAPAGVRFLDAGCGEGTYTAGIHRALAAAGRQPRTVGVDISKFILRTAARRCPEAEFAVASSYHLPLADESAELLLDCFSPLAIEEFHRVLAPGGVFLYVVPGAEHLIELKRVLYDEPYLNDEKPSPYPGFDYLEIVPVDAAAHLSGAADVRNLFAMTPYAWKTPRAGRERLLSLERLDVTLRFRIHVFRRV